MSRYPKEAEIEELRSLAIDGIPLKERDIDLRSLGSAIVAAIEKNIGEEAAQHWSITIQDVDPLLLKGKSDTRTNYRDKPREIILVLERGPITLISKRFKPDVCRECGFGVLHDKDDGG